MISIYQGKDNVAVVWFSSLIADWVSASKRAVPLGTPFWTMEHSKFLAILDNLNTTSDEWTIDPDILGAPSGVGENKEIVNW